MDTGTKIICCCRLNNGFRLKVSDKRMKAIEDNGWYVVRIISCVFPATLGIFQLNQRWVHSSRNDIETDCQPMLVIFMLPIRQGMVTTYYQKHRSISNHFIYRCFLTKDGSNGRMVFKHSHNNAQHSKFIEHEWSFIPCFLISIWSTGYFLP